MTQRKTKQHFKHNNRADNNQSGAAGLSGAPAIKLFRLRR